MLLNPLSPRGDHSLAKLPQSLTRLPADTLVTPFSSNAQSTDFTAEIAIQAIGARATDARLRVLGALIEAPQPLSHAEIEQALQQPNAPKPIDRVTVYRVLEWLVEHGLAHKIEGFDRVWRFNALSDNQGHAHFHCLRCARVYCLEGINPTIAIALPRGFSFSQMDLSLKGICQGCQSGELGESAG